MSDELKKWKEENLDTISKSFCAAKWYNASLHLGHGYTNSCHLPLPHPIDLEKIKIDPTYLHNTDHKKSYFLSPQYPPLDEGDSHDKAAPNQKDLV